MFTQITSHTIVLTFQSHNECKLSSNCSGNHCFSSPRISTEDHVQPSQTLLFSPFLIEPVLQLFLPLTLVLSGHISQYLPEPMVYLDLDWVILKIWQMSSIKTKQYCKNITFKSLIHQNPSPTPNFFSILIFQSASKHLRFKISSANLNNEIELH